MKSQGDSSFPTDGHTAILNRLDSQRQTKRGRTLTIRINHNRSIALERSLINYWGRGVGGGEEPVLRSNDKTRAIAHDNWASLMKDFVIKPICRLNHSWPELTKIECCLKCKIQYKVANALQQTDGNRAPVYTHVRVHRDCIQQHSKRMKTIPVA